MNHHADGPSEDSSGTNVQTGGSTAFRSSLELIEHALNRGYAVPSFCVWNAEMIATVLKVCRSLRSPVILMNGPGEFPLFPPEEMARIAAALLSTSSDSREIPVALHLDHGSDAEMARVCIAAGYSSVMVDLSHLPLAENIAGTREVVSEAKRRGVSVEGELGTVGREDEMSSESDGPSIHTDPEEVGTYVAETSVDLLAASFGNVHGAYRGEPNLDFGLLARIRDNAGIPLVLHGGSGISTDDLKRAIGIGIGKVNIASDLVNALRNSLIRQWNDGRNLWVPAALTDSMSEVAAVVERWVHSLGSEGQA